MSEIILYPTETIYALGVNVFDAEAWNQLCELKGRRVGQSASWLVRSVSDIERYAEVTDKARVLMEKYLPGPLTVVLRAESVDSPVVSGDDTIGFRISPDLVAQKVVAEYPLARSSWRRICLPGSPRS